MSLLYLLPILLLYTHRSPADFAQAKFVAVRRKFGYFPSGNPKNYVFRRAISDRPYMLHFAMKLFDSLGAKPTAILGVSPKMKSFSPGENLCLTTGAVHAIMMS